MSDTRSTNRHEVLLTLARAADVPVATISAWLAGCPIRPATRLRLLAAASWRAESLHRRGRRGGKR